MNAYLNYLLEASIGLCLFLLVYQLFLRKETSFRLNRIFLLVAIIASVTFPLLKLNTADSPVPSLNFSVEPARTELVYTEDSTVPESYSTFTTWEILAGLYMTGLAIFLIVFIIRLTGMLKALKKAAYTYNNHRIVELKSQDSPFSFFNYIFIGSTPPLTEKEKQQIIEHESIHAKLYHSLDILLLHALGIVFWFNPVIRIYKKIFVQLHEFEADARAAEKHDVDEYCSLLAKVALHSANYKLANHFSNSLTLKRIEMMRTLKHKIKSWKVIAVAMVIPVVFFVVSCQDQANESNAYPIKVQQAIDRLIASNPSADFIVVSPDGPNLKDFEGEHAKHLSYIDGQAVIESRSMLIIEIGQDENGNPINYAIYEYSAKKRSDLPSEDAWKTAGEVWEETLTRKDQSQLDGEPIFMAVEMSAEFPNGINAMNNFIKSNVHYPEGAKRIGLSGRVYIQFTVNKNGSLSDFTFIKGISKELDEEALRVMKLMPDWKPAMQNGKPVNSRFVLPIPFGSENSIPSEGIQEVTSSLQVEYSKKISGDKILVSGTVTDSNGNLLPGANVIIIGGSTGTSTDPEGNFKLTVPANTKKLEVSFKGFSSTALQL
jgi:TonB family protein